MHVIEHKLSFGKEIGNIADIYYNMRKYASALTLKVLIATEADDILIL